MRVCRAYANWTDDGWNVRVHGNVYKLPDIEQDKVDDLANVFLVDTDIEDLPEDQQAQARNVTRSIFVVQQDDEEVTIDFVSDVNVDRNASGGAIDAVRLLVEGIGVSADIMIEGRRTNYHSAVQHDGPG